MRYDYLKPIPAFAYENKFTVSGRASNLLNKPKINANIGLFGKDGKDGNFFLTTQTGKNGDFIFNDFPQFKTESANMLFKHMTEDDNSFGVGLEINLPVSPAVHAPLQTSLIETNNNDSIAIKQAVQHMQTYNRLKKEKGILQEVVVTGRAKIPGSKNLNDNGEYDEAITEKTLDSMPKTSILDVIYKKVPGLHKGITGNIGTELFLVRNNIAVFVIDGYNIYTEFLKQRAGSKFSKDVPKYTIFTEYQEGILKSITAEDVAGIEMFYTLKNKDAYEDYYNQRDDFNYSYTFIEITTHSGNGPFNTRSSGMYLYKPMVPVVARKFYSPLYNNTNNDNSLPDFRSTIFWKPDLVTNEKGEASFSFYTSDNSGGYLVIVQGTDLSGGLGASYLPLQIKTAEKKPGN